MLFEVNNELVRILDTLSDHIGHWKVYLQLHDAFRHANQTKVGNADFLATQGMKVGFDPDIEHIINVVLIFVNCVHFCILVQNPKSFIIFICDKGKLRQISYLWYNYWLVEFHGQLSSRSDIYDVGFEWLDLFVKLFLTSILSSLQSLHDYLLPRINVSTIFKDYHGLSNDLGNLWIFIDFFVLKGFVYIFTLSIFVFRELLFTKHSNLENGLCFIQRELVGLPDHEGLWTKS